VWQALTLTINDGTARVKTQFGVLAVDRRNGKAVCEQKTQQQAGGGAQCRFCHVDIASGAVEVNGIEGVCESDECRSHAEMACTKTHPCGHPCGGIRGEESCLPCLHCADTEGLFVDADDFCSICWTDNLAAAPCIQVQPPASLRLAHGSPFLTAAACHASADGVRARVSRQLREGPHRAEVARPSHHLQFRRLPMLQGRAAAPEHRRRHGARARLTHALSVVVL